MIRSFARLAFLSACVSAFAALSAFAAPAAAATEEAAPEEAYPEDAAPPAALSRTAFEDLFKWGDYDSLIRVLEPWVASGPPAFPTRADSADRGRANLYLGVAYWASGRQEQGVQAFTRAARLDRTLRLDPLYSTPEMEARFAAVRRAEEHPPPAPAGPRTGTPGGPGAAAPRSYDWLYWTGAVVVAGAAGGAWWYYKSREKPEDVVIVIDPEKPPR